MKQTAERMLYSVDFVDDRGTPIQYGVIVTNGIVTETPPKLNNFRSRTLNSLELWVRKLRGTVEPVVPVGPAPRKSHLAS